MENQKDELPYSLRCDYVSRWAENIRMHLQQSCPYRNTECSQSRTREILTKEVGLDGDILDNCKICNYKSKRKQYRKRHQAAHTAHIPFHRPTDGCEYRTKWPKSVIRYARGLYNTDLTRKAPIKTKRNLRSEIDCQNNMEVNEVMSGFSFACMWCQFIGDSESSALEHARQHRPGIDSTQQIQ